MDSLVSRTQRTLPAHGKKWTVILSGAKYSPDIPHQWHFWLLTYVLSTIDVHDIGKYVGNRPIKLRKSQWKDRNVEIIREPKAARGPYDPEAITRKERAKPYKVKKLNNAGK